MARRRASVSQAVPGRVAPGRQRLMGVDDEPHVRARHGVLGERRAGARCPPLFTVSILVEVQPYLKVTVLAFDADFGSK